jgi:type IV pilus assembly protein PilV
MQQKADTLRCSNQARGFTLMEVLIAMLVLAIGIMGVAGMQVTALKSLQSSGTFGVSAMLANDIADRMWVNQVQVLANAYDHTAAPTGVTDCVANTCSTAQMAAYDISEWQNQIKGYTTAGGTVVPAMLPSAAGAVARIGTSTSFLISVRWDDDHSGSTDTNCPPADADDLDCYQLTVTF